MQLKQIGSNMTELSVPGNFSVLFSYETPVAGWDGNGPFKTEEFYSRTTTKHINKYFGGQTDPRLVSQDDINQLLEG
jgi:hypothetical protein